MAGHVMNSRKANLKSSSVNDILFFYCAFRVKNEVLRVDQNVSNFNLQCFLRGSVGFEIDNCIHCHRSNAVLEV